MGQLDLFPALQSGAIVLGVAEKPTGVVWDWHFLVNQLYLAHPSARGLSV